MGDRAGRGAAREPDVVLQSRPVTTLPQRAPTGAASAISLVMGTFGAGENQPSS